MNKKEYIAPILNCLEIRVEKGFGYSPTDIIQKTDHLENQSEDSFNDSDSQHVNSDSYISKNID